MTSLDSNMAQVLMPYATSAFHTHSLLSVIGIVSGVIIAVVKPPMAKIGDVFGRMEAFLLSIVLYVAGYIQMAASSNVETYAVNITIVSCSWLECNYILCGWDNGIANHATDCDRRHVCPRQQGAFLFHSRCSLSLECMAWTCSWTTISRPSLVEMGLCYVCMSIAHLRRAFACSPVVEY